MLCNEEIINVCNCREIFDDDLKYYVGVTVWEIENFLPNQVEDCLHGKFYEGDCYIVLNVSVPAGQLGRPQSFRRCKRPVATSTTTSTTG